MRMEWEVIYKTDKTVEAIQFKTKKTAVRIVEFLMRKNEITGVAITKLEKGGVKE